MAKKLTVPVVRDDLLFDVIRGHRLLKYLGPFGIPGSIPPTLNYGMVHRCPELYNQISEPVITGTLRFCTVQDMRYVGPGIVMTNADTGAGYFMLPAEYEHMLNQAVSTRNQITGSWSVIKDGHAFSLRWITARVDPEPPRQD